MVASAAKPPADAAIATRWNARFTSSGARAGGTASSVLTLPHRMHLAVAPHRVCRAHPMAHDLIVIGGSSGAVQPLIALVGALPADLPAAIFIVVHVRPDAPSHLPAILNRSGALPAAHAVDGEPIRRSRIYVAPPGLQTYVHCGRITVRRGPHENSSRPAIDPLFRTAAHHYGP